MTTVHTARELVLTEPDQLKALSNDTRTKILQVLDGRPASAKQLSDLLEMSHGKTGHHLKVLERHGFVEVVETRQVRAMTEKLYGLTFERLRFAVAGTAGADRLQFLFSLASREAAPADRQPFEDVGRLLTVRMTQDQAAEFYRRIVELADEFASAESEGPMFGFAGSVFLVDMPGESS